MSAPVALTIAGSDSSGGAGIQADLKTFTALGVYGASVVTALTAQNTMGVTGVHEVPADFVAAQIDAVLTDLEVRAIKTGMLANATIIEAILAALGPVEAVPLVVDPVMVATSGADLIAGDAVAAVRDRLMPRADLITPNLPEAARLLDVPVATDEREMEAHARALVRNGARAVLLKGGHSSGSEAADLLLWRDGMRWFRLPRIDTTATHGTGCTLSSAIAACLATGDDLEHSVARAKSYVWQALEAGRSLGIGHGHGPLDHAHAIRRGAASAG